jgi:DNA-binding MarR family transcriptional regulator
MDKSIARKINREIMTISRCISYIRNIQFKKYNVGRGQHAFLTRIYENPGINQEELSYMLKIDKTTVAKSLKRLEENDFIKKVKSQEDNRQWLLYPTEKLISIYGTLESMITSTCIDALEGITEEECSTLLTLLTKVRFNVNENWEKVKAENK